ncbi:A/G-specific adenine glycosylase [Gallionella capsiferriformans]|uniref:A/G-specific adenine glycosylase n=1 Tax=Gallionella capsiferriformans TaxID=370405 RepID=UPI00031EA981|nr:A/G-specific adenine glycosylase [Gallionella capsiferriformans]
MSSFSSSLIAWQRSHGRHDLPWQCADPYCIWLSEIMLQQTQVVTVIPYYQRFVASFPTIAALASATEEQVLAHWSGLGYYARGRNLHRAAQIIVAQHGGAFPRQFELILALPGIGRSTAAAICALAYQQNRAILDGNVRRVLARYCGIYGSPAIKSVEARLWQQAEALLPLNDVDRYTQALMDMGATLCTRSRPKCASCPVQPDCVAHQTGCVADLPTPRQRRVVPERTACFLLLLVDHDVFMERREPAGIWGGLWCLPQFEDEAAALFWCAQHGVEAADRQRDALTPFTHTFTHFKLHITPLRVSVTAKPLHVLQTKGAWLRVSDALSSAIPAPVRTILEGYGVPDDAF